MHLWFEPDGGAEQYAQYGAAVGPLLANVGGQLLFPTMAVEKSKLSNLHPDLVAFVRYPSAEAHDALRDADDYRPLGQLRRHAITRAIATRCALDPVDAESMIVLPAGIAVLSALWFAAGGEQSFQTYMQKAAPLVHEHGGNFVEPRLRPLTSFGENFVPNVMVLCHYPSIEAFEELITSDAYNNATSILSQTLHHAATTILRVGANMTPGPAPR